MFTVKKRFNRGSSLSNFVFMKDIFKENITSEHSIKEETIWRNEK
jgi:hypothetical protein